MQILVLNTGSSSVKFSLIEAPGERTLLEGLADWTGEPAQLVVRRPGAEPTTSPLTASGHHEAVTQVLGQLTEDERRGVTAIGHRVVHGGALYTRSVLITPEVKAHIAQLAELAPLHNP